MRPDDAASTDRQGRARRAVAPVDRRRRERRGDVGGVLVVADERRAHVLVCGAVRKRVDESLQLEGSRGPVQELGIEAADEILPSLDRRQHGQRHVGTGHPACERLRVERLGGRIDPAGEHVAVERAQKAGYGSGALGREVFARAEHEGLQLLVRRAALQEGHAGRDLGRVGGAAEERQIHRADEP